MARQSSTAIKLLLPIILAGCQLTACSNESDAVFSDRVSCDKPDIPVSRIQGDQYQSFMTGREVTATGVVTWFNQDGLFIESVEPDENPLTSEGLFIKGLKASRTLYPGVVIQVTGTVAELGKRRNTQTALIDVTVAGTCRTGVPLPRTRASLPMKPEVREGLENMRIAVVTPSFATDVYKLGKGEIRISGNSVLPVPTEVSRPGQDARSQRSRNFQNLMWVQLSPEDNQVFPAGTELISDEGVLGHDGIGPRLYLEKKANLARQRASILQAPQPGSIRVVSLNLHNYFNGEGPEHRFPTARGAKSPAEFESQRESLIAAISMLRPDILAVVELENDGFDSDSAASDLLDDLSRATGAQWLAANPEVGLIGSDKITVGLFFRPDRARPLGKPELLMAAPFDLLNRTPIAQVFIDPGTGLKFLVNVNHFKSKGRCPDHGKDTDQEDGQSCWNSARLKAASALAPWVTKLADERAQGRALIVGDLNAYRLEDPVRHLVDKGFLDLTGYVGTRHRYSYFYFGESGTLDHALASPALYRAVNMAQILNINSPQPPGLPLPQPWLRFSDHDPVIVDLRLSQASTSN